MMEKPANDGHDSYRFRIWKHLFKTELLIMAMYAAAGGTVYMMGGQLQYILPASGGGAIATAMANQLFAHHTKNPPANDNSKD